MKGKCCGARSDAAWPHPRAKSEYEHEHEYDRREKAKKKEHEYEYDHDHEHEYEYEYEYEGGDALSRALAERYNPCFSELGPQDSLLNDRAHERTGS